MLCFGKHGPLRTAYGFAPANLAAERQRALNRRVTHLLVFLDCHPYPSTRPLPLHGKGRGREVERAEEGAEGIPASVF